MKALCLDCQKKPSVGLGRCIRCQQETEARTWDSKRYPPREIGLELDAVEEVFRPLSVRA